MDKLVTFTPPKPKRTFTLNGVELPCPINGIQDPTIYIRAGEKNGEYFSFATERDRDNALSFFMNLLTEARDK